MNTLESDDADLSKLSVNFKYCDFILIYIIFPHNNIEYLAGRFYSPSSPMAPLTNWFIMYIAHSTHVHLRLTDRCARARRSVH